MNDEVKSAFVLVLSSVFVVSLRINTFWRLWSILFAWNSSVVGPLDPWCERHNEACNLSSRSVWVRSSIVPNRATIATAKNESAAIVK